ncbi:MAG: tail fiber domain-containing protein, partial [Nitrosarchaeum sp.]
DVFLKGNYGNTIRLLTTAGSGGPYVDISPMSAYYGYSYLGLYNNWRYAFMDNLYIYEDLTVYGTCACYSDKNLKKNIKGMNFNKDFFYKLNPVNYDMVDSIRVNSNSGQKKLVTFKKKEYPINGFIAQEVQKIYPDLVEEDSITGLLKIKTLEFIPIIVKALQTQQEEIDALKSEIKTLKGTDSTLQQKVKQNIGVNEVNSYNISILEQNNPNPFSEETKISFTISEDVSNANLMIYDMNGKELKEITISERSTGDVIIKGSEFAAGMYIYALITDGVLIDTKRMILTK